MSKSFRLDAALEKRLDALARARGVSVSSLIREAVVRQCEESEGQSLRLSLADVLGSVDSSGGRARRTGRAFQELLAGRKNR